MANNAAEGPSTAGMVTSPHPLASRIGADILARGGNAIEAAVAIGAALAVTMPHFCGLGGDAVWLIADGRSAPRCLLGIGQAARTLPRFDGPIPLRGPQSMITSACVVDSWDHALSLSRKEWRGALSFRDLIAPAIALAEEGFEPAGSQRFWTDFRRADSRKWPGFAALFDLTETQAVFRQPELASSLTYLAEEGPRSFYEGTLAKFLARGFEAVGAPLTAADLAATRTQETEPLSLDYRGLTLLAPPPPTQGASTLAIMGILSRFDMAALASDNPQRYHLLVEAVKQAFLDRDRIADPSDMQVAIEDLLTEARMDEKAASINTSKALPWPHLYRDGDTVFFAATDSAGLSVSILQSTYFDWGSGIALPGTGILWQNRGAAFSTQPGHPNEIRPGKRPFYTLNPGLALSHGKPRFLYGTQGADGQPQTLSVLLSGLIDAGLSPEQALAQPRFLLGKTFSDSRDSLKLEASLGDDAIGTLAALGHDVVSLPALSPIFGQAGVIAIAPDGSKSGAHDPRGEGIAIAVEREAP